MENELHNSVRIGLKRFKHVNAERVTWLPINEVHRAKQCGLARIQAAFTASVIARRVVVRETPVVPIDVIHDVVIDIRHIKMSIATLLLMQRDSEGCRL